MRVLGLDPGPEKSAMVLWDGSLYSHLYAGNEEILAALKAEARMAPVRPAPQLVIEKIASFGMPVGAEVFETVFWSGRFAEAYGIHSVDRVTRGEVKMHLCHSMRAKDGNVRQALIDRFGAVGSKNKRGPLYGMAGDLWSALAVAVTWYDQHAASTGTAKEENAE